VTTTVRPRTGGALKAYRVMAYVVGVLLAVLVLVAVPLQLAGHKGLEVVLGTAHGYLYVLLLLSIANLAFRRRMPLLWIVLVALAGTVPFLSFVAERQVTARVRDGRL